MYVCFTRFRSLCCCCCCVCVYVVWWALCGQHFVGLRATQLMGQLAQPQNPSGLITAPVHPPSSFFFYLPLFLLLTPILPSFPFPPVHAVNPVWRVTAPVCLLEYTSHPQREGPSQLAALTLIDLAPMLTQTPRETL